jgi:hypothetical protein
MDTRLPDGFKAEGGAGGSSKSESGVHIHGLSNGQGLVIAGVACFALGVSIVNMVQTARWQADMRSRYEESYSELSREVRLNTQATDDMRASLIARGINPNNHDVTDVGGAKP